MKITLHRPIYVDAEAGVVSGNFDMADERRAKALIGRGLAGEGYNAKAAEADLKTRAVAGAPENRSAKASTVVTKPARVAKVAKKSTRR